MLSKVGNQSVMCTISSDCLGAILPGQRIMPAVRLLPSEVEKYPPRQGPGALRLPGPTNEVSRPLSPAKITIVLSRSPSLSSLSRRTLKSPSTIWIQSATAPPFAEPSYSTLGSIGTCTLEWLKYMKKGSPLPFESSIQLVGGPTKRAQIAVLG